MRPDLDAAMAAGDLTAARAILNDAATSGGDRGLLIDGYADLAQALDRRGDHDAAIDALHQAIEHGYEASPDPRSDIAEYHLRAGRADVAAGIWARLREEMPDDVWLYNAAGLSHQEIGAHEHAVSWFTDGLAVAMRTGDPEGLTAQLADLRERSLQELGHPSDALQAEATAFAATWQRPIRAASNAAAILGDASQPERPIAASEQLPMSLAWFPATEYERALSLWPSLAEDWSGVPHEEYSARMDGHARWLRAQGARVHAISPLPVDELIAYCQSRDLDPEESRAAFAAEQSRIGRAVPWPPTRNQPCWCGSNRKYKKCCGAAPAVPMHPAVDDR